VKRATMARIDHEYKVFVRNDLMAEASSTIACVDANGHIRRMPEILVRE
jgi:acyl-CoA thioester hydrolase